MPKAAASEFIRLLDNELQEFGQHYNFSFGKSMVIGRVYGGSVFHRIGFAVEKGRVGCDVSIKPLYVRQNRPGTSLIVDLGDYSETRGNWSYTDAKNNIIEHVHEIGKLLRAVALPLFEQYGTPHGIIRLLQEDWDSQTRYRFTGVRPYKRFMFIAYSYIYLGLQMDSAVEYLQRVLETMDVRNIPDELARDEAEAMLTLLENGNEEQIRIIMNQIIIDMGEANECHKYPQI